MISDLEIKGSSGKLTIGVERDQSIKAVIDFVRERFKEFSSLEDNMSAMNEKGLSQKLVIFLNRKAKNFPFFFHSEFLEDVNSGISPQVDIGTLMHDEKIIISDRDYGADDSFFSIEAKRLPTVGTNREKEYVVGIDRPCGGMERFKNGVHGSRIKHSALVGFVQKENFDHWFIKINEWIVELANDRKMKLWSKNDQIKKVNFKSHNVAELNSKNLRIVGSKKDEIEILHFWINLIK